MIDNVPIDQLPPSLRELQIISTAACPPHEAPSRAARAIAHSVGRPAPPDSWSLDDSAVALRVQVCRAARGGATLGWVSALWKSPPAALSADSLSELARAADEARAAELHVGTRVEPAVAALVLGTLASRLGPARVRLHVDAPLSRAMAEAVRMAGATVAGATEDAPAQAISIVCDPQEFRIPRRDRR
jgi:glucose-6-phosphate dehydrogenase assembly protein OpcA